MTHPAPTLIVPRGLAFNARLSGPARLIGCMTLSWQPRRDPAITTLARYLGVGRSTVVAAQKELAAEGFEYVWAKGGPENRLRHRLVSLPDYADPAKGRFGVIAGRFVAELHGQPTALLILALDSTGTLLSPSELTEFVGCNKSTVSRARGVLRAVLYMGADR